MNRKKDEAKKGLGSYKGGALLSGGLLIVLILLNDQLYSNVMNLSLPVTLIVLHILIFKYLIPQKRYVAYSAFLLILVLAIYLALPALTQQEAQHKAAGLYQLEQVKATTVPTLLANSWNPFEADSAYFFTGQSPAGEQIYLLVNPANGKVVMSEPYEGFGKDKRDGA